MHSQVDVVRIENLDGCKPGVQAKITNPSNEPMLIAGIAMESVQVSGVGKLPELTIALSPQVPVVGDYVLPPIELPAQISDAPMYTPIANPRDMGIYSVLQPNQTVFVHISRETDGPVYFFDLLVTLVSLPPKLVQP